MRVAEDKILKRSDAKAKVAELKSQGNKVVFTNGAFDVLHSGHVTYLRFSREQGDVLVVGLNSDQSVKSYKDARRPINGQDDRARVLAALECVDCVVIFDEDEPAELIAELLPNVLVKGEDWAHYVSGRDVVEQNGGKVVLAPLVEGRSTTGVVEKILKAYGGAASSYSHSSSSSSSNKKSTE